MSTIKVEALYDFVGEKGSAELSITAGQQLSVVRQNVGEGWWEGTNEAGETGLFPAAYVKEVTNNPPSVPPPPLPEAFSNDHQAWLEEPWNSQEGQSNTNANADSGDYWDDEWDDDSEGGDKPNTQPNQNFNQGYSLPKSSSSGDVSSLGKADSKGTVGRKNFNRFTAFVKSGGESYILGTSKVTASDSEKVYIYEDEEENIIWNPISEQYTCQITSPKKEYKLKGLKKFIAYQITPTFNNIQVARRYKHFDWLHGRMEEKFTLIPIPPLPDKQFAGRYDEQFIEHRRVQLQAFVDYICRHPVLSKCAVWQHFITCTDEKRWKAGKRKAERDELLGANYFIALQPPEKPLDIPKLELESESFAKFIHGVDSTLKNLMATGIDQTKKHQGPYKREYQKIGHAFASLGQAFAMEEHPGSNGAKLTSAIRHTGHTYHEIGKLFEDQPRVDWEPLGDMLLIYKGIITSFPDILTVHRGSVQKRRECEKLAGDHKMELTQLQEVTRRTDVVSYALLAEINHFHSERIVDFTKAMRNFLSEQINFYSKVVEKLQNTLEMYDNE